jgi:hypothetical protein
MSTGISSAHIDHHSYDHFATSVDYDTVNFPTTNTTATTADLAYGLPASHQVQQTHPHVHAQAQAHLGHVHQGTHGAGGGIMMGAYGRISLPSVSTLHLSAFKDSLRDAERRAETGHYEAAEEALGSAMRCLQWVKGVN